jgi:PucR family transcriptional regulator, purine catabolism regulatory protein
VTASQRPEAESGPRPPAVPSLAATPSHNSVYRRMTAVCDRMADAALRGAPAPELAAVFSRVIRKTVLLLDPEFRLTAYANPAGPVATATRWNPDAAGVAGLLRVLAGERRPLRVPPVPGSALSHGCLAMPVTAGERALGYLLVLDEPNLAAPEDADLVITSYAATLFALALAREQTTLELGLRYQGTIVDSLLCGHFLDHLDARRKVRELGFADSQPFRVAVARLPSGEAQPATSQGSHDTQSLLSAVAISAHVPFTVRGQDLRTIVPHPPEGTPSLPSSAGDRPLAVLTGLLASGPAAGPQLTCGISELVDSPELAPDALRQAEQAIEIGTRLGRAGQIIRYEDLGIYRLLLQIDDMNQLWRFACDVLGPLIEYDASHKVDLIATLSAYLGQHESLKQTARVLRVHVNTVAYRVQRIEQLACLDLADPDDRLAAHVAVKIVESHQASRKR